MYVTINDQILKIIGNIRRSIDDKFNIDKVEGFIDEEFTFEIRKKQKWKWFPKSIIYGTIKSIKGEIKLSIDYERETPDNLKELIENICRKDGITYCDNAEKKDTE